MESGEDAPVISYTSGYKYQLMARYQIETGLIIKETITTPLLSLEDKGKLTIHRGYAWDGPSGPTIDWPKGHVMRGALVHDALYQLMRQGQLAQYHRPAIDELMLQIMLKDGMWGWRAQAWYVSVRRVAGMAGDPRSRKVVHYAG